MKIAKYQKGGLVFKLVMVVVAIIVAVIGMQVLFAVLEQQTIKSAVKSTLLEEKNNDGATVRGIQDTIFKKLNVNSMDLDKDDVFIQKNGRLFTVDITFIKEIKLTEQAKLNLDLSFSEDTPQ